MAYDNSVRLLGTSGNPRADLSGNGSGSAVFVGKYKSFVGELRVAGKVTGTLDTMIIQESTDGSSGWTTAATLAPSAISASDVGYFTGGTTPAYEVPGTFWRTAAFVTSKAYVRATYTLTTGPINGVSVELMPKATATLRSGVA